MILVQTDVVLGVVHIGIALAHIGYSDESRSLAGEWFEATLSSISGHLNAIVESGELRQGSGVAFFETTETYRQKTTCFGGRYCRYWRLRRTL